MIKATKKGARGKQRGGVFWSSGGISTRDWDYRQVKAGPDMPIPESRPDVLKKIQERLDAEGSFRQNYSNGEFISSSIAVSRTFEGCKSVQVLECPGYTIHFDSAQNLYWRRGGCFD
jgi:hypothetical protein